MLILQYVEDINDWRAYDLSCHTIDVFVAFLLSEITTLFGFELKSPINVLYMVLSIFYYLPDDVLNQSVISTSNFMLAIS